MRKGGALLLLAVWGAAGLAACATTPKGGGGPDDEDASDADQDTPTDITGDSDKKGHGEASVSVRYAKTAKGNWKRGEREYADENYAAAQKFYTYVKAKFPYSAYAIKAELRIGDCLFGRGRYLEAIDAFQNFVRLHPGHPEIAYATFKTGEAYYQQIPSDWFLLPPSEEKDQSSVRDAERALRAYVERFPGDESFKKGSELLADTRKRLVAHERYAADFYKGIGKPKAYAGRLEVIHTKFADVAVDDALLYELVAVYVEIGELAKAEAIGAELDQRFPRSPKVKDARALLARARAKAKRAPASKPAAPA